MMPQSNHVLMRKARFAWFNGVGATAGENLGKSIKNATSHVLDEAHGKFLPEIRNMLLGNHADLIAGVQAVTDKTIGEINETTVPKMSKEIHTIANHTVKAARKEFESMFANIQFKSSTDEESPDERLFNMVRQSFLRNRIRYLDLQALGEGRQINTSFTDKNGTQRVGLHVVGGMVFAEYDLSESFTTSKSLLLMNSISPLFTFHMPEKAKVWCRMVVPPEHVIESAHFACAGILFIHDFISCAQLLKGDEDPSDIRKELEKVMTNKGT